MVLDDLFSPADMDTVINPYVGLEPGSPIAESDNFICLGMDPNISDSEPPEDVSSPVSITLTLTDSDSAIAELHPVLEATLETPANDFDIAELHPTQEAPADSSSLEKEQVSVDLDQDDVSSAGTADLPEVVRRLQKQLLNGYTCPVYPPVNDPSVVHSLKWKSFL
jgi:hypothetical protein